MPPPRPKGVHLRVGLGPDLGHGSGRHQDPRHRVKGQQPKDRVVLERVDELVQGILHKPDALEAEQGPGGINGGDHGAPRLGQLHRLQARHQRDLHHRGRARGPKARHHRYAALQAEQAVAAGPGEVQRAVSKGLVDVHLPVRRDPTRGQGLISAS